MDKNDVTEPDTKKLTPKQIREAVRELTERKKTYQGYLNELAESGETQLLLTDPEARRMHSKDGFHCCYNVQTAVDGGSHLIADYVRLQATIQIRDFWARWRRAPKRLWRLKLLKRWRTRAMTAGRIS
jgi:hypothetical protein